MVTRVASFTQTGKSCQSPGAPGVHLTVRYTTDTQVRLMHIGLESFIHRIRRTMKSNNAKSHTPAGSDKVQGEGDYEAAERYDTSVKSFVKCGKGAEAARKAAPGSPQEAEELKSAERAGLARSKGEDPASARAPDRNRGPL